MNSPRLRPAAPVPEVGPGQKATQATPAPRGRTAQGVIIGAGGHGRELADIVREMDGLDVELLGIVDDGEPDRLLLARGGLRLLGNTDHLRERLDLVVWIGVGAPHVRARLDAEFGERSSGPLIHPTASVGSLCDLAPGVVVAQNSVVTTNVTLGRHSHCGVGSTISHDVRIGSHVTICPGVRITGAVDIGDRVFVGAGAVVLPGIRVGDDALIGAGAVVTRDVAAGATVAGVPARSVD